MYCKYEYFLTDPAEYRYAERHVFREGKAS